MSNPNIVIGDYTYYDDPEDSEGFERNVLYHFDFIGDRLSGFRQNWRGESRRLWRQAERGVADLVSDVHSYGISD